MAIETMRNALATGTGIGASRDGIKSGRARPYPNLSRSDGPGGRDPESYAAPARREARPPDVIESHTNITPSRTHTRIISSIPYGKGQPGSSLIQTNEAKPTENQMSGCTNNPWSKRANEPNAHNAWLNDCGLPQKKIVQTKPGPRSMIGWSVSRKRQRCANEPTRP